MVTWTVDVVGGICWISQYLTVSIALPSTFFFKYTFTFRRGKLKDKTNNHLSPHGIWRWKSKSWLETGTKMWRWYGNVCYLNQNIKTQSERKLSKTCNTLCQMLMKKLLNSCPLVICKKQKTTTVAQNRCRIRLLQAYKYYTIHHSIYLV